MNYVSGPKYLYDQGSKVYELDPGAYYDPTLEDKQKRIKYLQSRIEILNEQMKLNFKVPEFTRGNVKIGIQNFTNKNKEETNGFIGRSYYYPVGNNSAPAVQEKSQEFQPKGVPRVESQRSTGTVTKRVQEVEKGSLVDQPISSANNEVTAVKYKTISSNTIISKKSNGDVEKAVVKPTTNNETTVVKATNLKSQTTISQSQPVNARKDHVTTEVPIKPAPRDPPMENPTNAMPTSISTDYVPNTSSDRKSYLKVTKADK